LVDIIIILNLFSPVSY